MVHWLLVRHWRDGFSVQVRCVACWGYAAADKRGNKAWCERWELLSSRGEGVSRGTGSGVHLRPRCYARLAQAPRDTRMD